jgi:hypothetical protein
MAQLKAGTTIGGRDIVQELANRIVNAGSVPSIQAGPDAEKPAPGTAGRLYVATDTQIIYRDTGTAWQKVGAVKWDDIEEKPDLALASDLAAHLADDMPHMTTDSSTNKVYRWGLAIQNGEWGILYEEVV